MGGSFLMSKPFIARVAIILLVIVLVVSIVSPAFAEDGTSLFFPDLDLKVVVPSGFDILTRDMSANDPLFEKYGFTRDQLLSTMKAQNTYLDAISSDGFTELTISRYDSTFSDFNLASDTALKALESVFREMFADVGTTMDSYRIYSHSQEKYVKVQVHRSVTEGTIYTQQYTTVRGGVLINFTLQSYSGSGISSSQESILKKLVDSAQFGTPPATTNVPQSTKSFTYKDSIAGIQFTVPAGWKETPLSKEREIIKAKFVTDKEPGLTILYGFYDLWNTMTKEEKGDLKRSDIDMFFLSKSDIAEAFSIPAEKVNIVEYNGQQYYRAETDSEALGLSIKTTVLYHIFNGYVYQFQFSGVSGDRYYEDFESLLQSIEYIDSQTGKTITFKKSSEASTYRDSETGMEFNIPARWKETSLSTKREYSKAMFVTDKDPDLSIIYGYYDVWNNLSEEEKDERNRSEINMSTYSAIDLSILLNTTTTKIEKTAYAGKQYYRIETYSRSNGKDFTTTTLYHVANGYVYQFSFSDKRTNQYYQDFESLLQSVKYEVLPVSITSKPNATDVPVATPSPTKAASRDGLINNMDYTKWGTIAGILLWALLPGFIARKKGRSFWAYYFLSLVITPLITMIITLCLGKKNNLERKDTPIRESNELTSDHYERDIYNTNVVPVLDQSVEKNGDTSHGKLVQEDLFAEHHIKPTASTEDEVVFCRYCGFKLLDGSAFCSHCGKKVR